MLEIRTKGAMREFCTPVTVGEETARPEALKRRHMGEFLYIMKNMTYMQYCSTYGVGESDQIYLLFPENLNTDYDKFISEAAVTATPGS